MYDTNYEIGTRFVALRAIWQDGDWTLIYDPEMGDVFNDEALEHISVTYNTIVLSFVSQLASRTYSFAKYNGKKMREFFIVNEEIVRSIGTPIAEELTLSSNSDLTQLAANFGIHLEMKSSGPYTVHRLGYSEDLKRERWQIDTNRNIAPVFDRGNYIVFRKFKSVEECYPLVELLREKEIPYQIVDNSFSADFTFGSNPQTEKELKLLKKDFEKVDQMLEQMAAENIKALPKDHYLYQFNEEELTEIIQKPDEWSKEDHLLAQQILNSKGITYSKEKIARIKQERIKDLSKPESGDGLWTLLGYLFALCGGIIGALIGWHLLNFKKILPNGDRVYNYKNDVRTHGKRIFIIGVVVMLFLISWAIFHS